MIPVRADGTPLPPLSEDELEYPRARQAAGARFENGSCDDEPVAADPPPTNQDTEGPIAAHQFECSVTYVDAFEIAAGIDAVEEYSFSVADDGIEGLNYPFAEDIPEVLSLLDAFVAASDR